jgi:hypothetical protein
LHFSLGLVELPIYLMPNGDRLVAPRVLARTTIVTRNVVAVPDGYALQEAENPLTASEIPLEGSASAEAFQSFWKEFLGHLKLDDPEQQIPGPASQGYLAFMLPAQGGSSWLTVYRNMKRGEVGVFLSSSRNSAGEYAMQVIVDEWGTLKDQLAGTAEVIDEDGRPRIIDKRTFGRLDQSEVRKKAFAWLAERVNTFVNVMRPRVRSAAADFQSRGERGAA